VGIDLGDRHSCYSVQNEAGEEVESGKLPTTQAGLRKHWEGEGPHRIVIEAGTSSNWVRTELEGMGHEVIVANPREVPGITRSGNKSDPEDAFKLALYGRVDARILHPIQHRSLEAQRDLAVIRARAGLVAARTQLINMSRGLAKNLGERLASCGSEQFARRVKRDLPAELVGSLGPVLKTVETLNEQIRELDTGIERLVREKYPEALRLQQVWGVGPVTALCYVLTLEDPERYLQSRSVGALLGLRPKRSQSGQRDPQLGISKTGDRQLRWLLVECAQRVMSKKGPDSDLKRWGLQLCERGGKNAKKRAIVAVARKLAVLLHKLWKSGAV
jgi:transposase